MNEFDAFSSYVATATNDGTQRPDLSTFFGILKYLRAGEAADGHPWSEHDLPPGRGVSLARTERALVGLQTVLEMLRAAERCRVAAQPEQHLDEGVIEGMFLACRGLAEWACHEIRPE